VLADVEALELLWLAHPQAAGEGCQQGPGEPGGRHGEQAVGQRTDQLDPQLAKRSGLPEMICEQIVAAMPPPAAPRVVVTAM